MGRPLSDRRGTRGAARAWPAAPRRDEGAPPPFRLRPGLIAEILRFYDTLRRNQKDVATFERLALGALEPGAAGRSRRASGSCARHGSSSARSGTSSGCARRPAASTSTRCDPRCFERAASRPWRHAVLAVGDRSRDPHGLTLGDWDLLVARARSRADRRRRDQHDARRRVSRADPPAAAGHRGGARRVGRRHGAGPAGAARRRPDSPGARSRGRSGRLRPLGEAVGTQRRGRRTSNVSPSSCASRCRMSTSRARCCGRRAFRARCSTRCRSPPSRTRRRSTSCSRSSARTSRACRRSRCCARRTSALPCRSIRPRVEPGSRIPDPVKDIAALDRALERRRLPRRPSGALVRLVEGWRRPRRRGGVIARARRAGGRARAACARAAATSRASAVADHLDAPAVVSARSHETPAGSRTIRCAPASCARASAILAHARLPPRRLSALRCRSRSISTRWRRWCGGGLKGRPSRRAPARRASTSSTPRARSSATSIDVQLAGLVDGEWPDRPRRNIFYSAGHPARSRLDRRVRAPRRRPRGVRRSPDTWRRPSVLVSGFTLEDDAVVAPSTLLDEVEAAGLDAVEWQADRTRIFEHEALGLEPVTSWMPFALAARERRRCSGCRRRPRPTRGIAARPRVTWRPRSR